MREISLTQTNKLQHIEGIAWLAISWFRTYFHDIYFKKGDNFELYNIEKSFQILESNFCTNPIKEIFEIFSRITYSSSTKRAALKTVGLNLFISEL